MCVAGRGGGHGCGLFICMDLYIYSDESGTFDVRNNDYFIFGGLILLGKEERDIAIRKYAHVENMIRGGVQCKNELKASKMANSTKGKVYRSLKGLHRFAVIIHQKDLHPEVFHNKRHKQRYLDFAYKIALKKALEHLLKQKIITERVTNVYVFCDEHQTCTDAVYELREALLSEFKNGTFNSCYERFYEPIFKNLKGVHLSFCDSSVTHLIRAADVIANHFYHLALSEKRGMEAERNAFVIHLPSYLVSSYGDEVAKDVPFLSESEADRLLPMPSM